MESLIKLLEQQLTESDVNQSVVGDQIARNYRYYSLQAIGNEVRGRSHYISPDVLDSVESKKALFKETFLSNRQAVKFTSNGMAPQDEADAKTAYVNQCLKRNKHSRLFPDFWHDAFLAKRGVFHGEWVEDTIPVEIPIQGMTEQQIYQVAAQQGNVRDIDTSQLEMVQVPTMQGLAVVFTGTLIAHVDDSYLSISKPTPERYYRDTDVADVEDAMWAGFSEDIPRGTLKDDGYDIGQIDQLQKDYRWREDTVDYARSSANEAGSRKRQYSRSDDQETVTVFKTWTWLNLADEYDGYPDEVRLYEIHWASGEVLKRSSQDGQSNLAIREAQEMPFFEWSELRIPDTEHGMCDADVVSHTQKTQSTLKRLIIDNQQHHNNPGYEAVLDKITNPRDLTDRPIGGVVWSEMIGSVAPLAVPELSPLTMGVIGMLQQDNERRSGMSSLATGMNTDVLRYQNAESMIDKLSAQGKSRPTSAARDWAHNCLIPLCQFIVKLGMRFDQSQSQIEVAGRVVPVIPSQWSDDILEMEPAVALTPEEGASHAQQLLMLHSMISQDEQLSQLYGVTQRHALMDSVFDAMGVSDTTRYMMRPDSPEYKNMQQQMAMQAKKVEQKQDQVVQSQLQAMVDDQTRKWAEANSKIMDTLADNEREDKIFQWDRYVDQQEISIERDQDRQAQIG